MKTLHLLALIGVLAATASAQDVAALKPPVPPNPEILAATDADTAWQTASRIDDSSAIQRQLEDLSPAQRVPVAMRLYVQAIRDEVAFIQKFPQDPRRWDAILKLVQISEGLAAPDGSLQKPFTPLSDLPWDAAAWAAWLPQIRALKAQIATAPDASTEARFRVELEQPGGLNEVMQDVQAAMQKKAPVDLAPVRGELLRMAAKYPDASMVKSYAAGYVMLLELAGTSDERFAAELKDLAANSDLRVSTVAQKELAKRAKLEQPLEIAFTAVDGRKVDLKELRGKVVLVDFWATWCGPCKEEIPNVKKVYATYHDKGFEIIGISLENGQLKATDTPEQIATKLAKARKVLTDFTAQNDMTWPQYFDGKFWKNDLSTRYEIGSIPAMFLIDQNGKLVSTNARGEKLEQEVKRLLKL